MRQREESAFMTVYLAGKMHLMNLLLNINQTPKTTSLQSNYRLVFLLKKNLYELIVKKKIFVVKIDPTT